MIRMLAIVILTATPVGAVDKAPECVVLLHGLARTEKSMDNLADRLKEEGFCVVNTDYPSREKTIQDLAIEAIPDALTQCRTLEADVIHFVTHSMGGILVRYYLEHYEIEELGRVVMLSPPNKGSEAVDKLADMTVFQWINGPAGQQLGTGLNSLPKTLGSPNYEVGIITGDRSVNPVLSSMIPGDDDGKVSVENAKLGGMKDFIVVHNAHPFIMSDETVIQQVIYFLKHGVFER